MQVNWFRAPTQHDIQLFLEAVFFVVREIDGGGGFEVGCFAFEVGLEEGGLGVRFLIFEILEGEWERASRGI